MPGTCAPDRLGFAQRGVDQRPGCSAPGLGRDFRQGDANALQDGAFDKHSLCRVARKIMTRAVIFHDEPRLAGSVHHEEIHPLAVVGAEGGALPPVCRVIGGAHESAHRDLEGYAPIRPVLRDPGIQTAQDALGFLVHRAHGAQVCRRDEAKLIVRAGEIVLFGELATARFIRPQGLDLTRQRGCAPAAPDGPKRQRQNNGAKGEVRPQPAGEGDAAQTKCFDSFNPCA